ncbi:thioredoxin [Virgibacillus halophilus]|uniref:Thioredoxin n=1 Tax=Tigheibacillus halophilus TaxID=361280 RepID=A0ABU5C6Y7_9BACI|nr:thioredoxin [Virgibacillus halophilus]
MRLLKFETVSCPRCALVSKFLLDHHVTFESIDAVKQPEKAEAYLVTSVPTMILFAENGMEIMRSTGVNPPELIQMIEIMSQEGTLNHV